MLLFLTLCLFESSHPTNQKEEGGETEVHRTPSIPEGGMPRLGRPRGWVLHWCGGGGLIALAVLQEWSWKDRVGLAVRARGAQWTEVAWQRFYPESYGANSTRTSKLRALSTKQDIP